MFPDYIGIQYQARRPDIIGVNHMNTFSISRIKI